MASKNSNISVRAQQLLKELIVRHIQAGQPVGSRTLAEETNLGLSAATIRSVMSDLEERGYLESPHTSAGRVPTQQAYRFFVDSLLQVETLTAEEISQLKQQLQAMTTVEKILESASRVVSGLTSLASVVTLPKREVNVLRHIEFLPLSNSQVLVVLVINDQEVHNRVIEIDNAFTRSELQRMANYLLSLYAGIDLTKIREHLVEAMRQDKQRIDVLAQAALVMVSNVLASCQQQDDYIVAGQSNLLQPTVIDDIDKLRQLFSTFTEKQQILHLLDKCLSSQDIQIFIGQEAGLVDFAACSMVSKSYLSNGQVVGALGVIGPVRMAYERVIPVVEVTVKLLSQVLTHA